MKSRSKRYLDNEITGGTPWCSRPFTHGGDIRAAAEAYGIPPGEFIDFSANINPLGMSSRAQRLLGRSLDLLSGYPDPECQELKNELARSLGIPTKNLLIGNGSVELIYAICRAVRPKRVLIPVPTFSEYERAACSVRAECLFIQGREDENFRTDLSKCRALLSRIDLVFLCNPGNPTGHLLAKEAILSFVAACRRAKIFIILDEAFVDFIVDGDRRTLIKEAARRENLLVLRSLTKFFALPGLRIGYMVGSEEIVQAIRRVQAPWSVNALAQIVAKDVIHDGPYIKRSKEYIARERDHLYRALKAINGLSPYKPTANFIFCRLTGGTVRSTALCHALGRRGLLVRDGANFRGLNDHFIRIAVRKKEENRLLINALKEVLNDARG